MKYVVVCILIILALYGCAGGNVKDTADETQSTPARQETPSGRDVSSSSETAEEPMEEEHTTAEEPMEEAESSSAPESGKMPAKARAGSKEATGDIEFMEEGEAYESESPGPSPPAAASEKTSAYPAPPTSSGLKAGFADDNQQFGYFTRFLDEYNHVPHFPLPIEERIVLTVLDAEGESIPNADVRIRAGDTKEQGKTTADGRYLFFPNEFDAALQSYTAEITVAQNTISQEVDRYGKRSITIQLPEQRSIPSPVPLDILFVFDTTGSMGEEIERLKNTIELIHMNLTHLTADITLRFGMVLYKDDGDEYRTNVVPLTTDLDAFQESLYSVQASGGGDTPEDLQAALAAAMNAIRWNKNGIRLGFIITDAPPHLDYNQDITYVDAAREAKSRAIKLFTIGTGGLPLEGEYVLRQISQYTSGKYIFLTYGEQGESEGGKAGSVSHHTGANYQTDKLESIIIRFAKEELSHVTSIEVAEDQPYFEARRIDEEEKEETLNKLFTRALQQLIDFSTIAIEDRTPILVLPITATETASPADAEYFSAQLGMVVQNDDLFRRIDRDNLQTILDELKLQLTGLTDDSQKIEVGALVNAELLLSGTLYRRKQSNEVFLQLQRVETGEVLSVTKAVIDVRLGLEG